MHGSKSRMAQKLDVQCCWKHPCLWKYCSNVFLFTSGSGSGTEWKYMHRGGRKELQLCLEQHMSKPLISRSWNSLIFWPFHSELTSKLKCSILWNENIREIDCRVLKHFGSVQHVLLLKWKCTWPSFMVWACPVCPPVRQHLPDHTLVLCPKGRSLCICRLVGLKLALVV